MTTDVHVLILTREPERAGPLRSLIETATDAQSVAVVTKLEDAARAIRTTPPQVAFIEYGLEAIRGSEALARLPFGLTNTFTVLLTDVDDGATAVEALRAGFDDFLTQDELTPGTIRRVFRIATRQREADQALERHRAHERLMGDVATRFVGVAPETFRDAMTRALGLIADSFDANVVTFCFKDDEQENVVYHWEQGCLQRQSGSTQHCCRENMPWLTSGMATGRGACIDNAARLPVRAIQDRAWLAGSGTAAMLAAPVSTLADTAGCLAVRAWTPRPQWGKQDVEMLRACADVIMVAWRRTRAEERMRQSQRKFGAIFAESLDALVITDTDGFIQHANPTLYRSLGYPLGEMLGQPFTRLFPPPEAPSLNAWRDALWEHDGVIEAQPFRHRAGHIVPMDVTATIIPWDTGKAILLNLRDATQRLAEADEHQRLAEAIAQSQEGVVITDADGTIHYVNTSFERMTGYASAELLGAKTSILRSGKHEDAFYADLWQTIKSGSIWHGRIVNRRKDGQLYTEEMRISPIRNRQGVIESFVAVKSDVTQRVHLELQLRQAQKMEAIGTLSGGIAHDFNNILSPILGYVDMVVNEMSVDNEYLPYLREVYKAAERARELVKQILTFSRQGEQAWQPVPVATVVKEALKLLRASIPATIDIQTAIDLDAGHALGDPTQVHQILMNLCTNAYHAMREEGGTLRVALCPIDALTPIACAGAQLSPGPYLRLTVSDTGHGMDEQTIEKIFIPFFTTKPVGEGTGMGLAMVHGIMTSHQGGIQVSSEVGVGTTFTVYFPAIEQAAETTEVPELVPPMGPARILVVDDEVAVAELAATLLRRRGYETSVCGSGEEALERFMEAPDAIDCVLSDQTMPRLTGARLVERLLELRPELPVVLMTGYSDQITESQALQLGCSAFLMKPLSLRALSEAVQQALGARNGAASGSGAPANGTHKQRKHPDAMRSCD